jgi:hypothetical protein
MAACNEPDLLGVGSEGDLHGCGDSAGFDAGAEEAHGGGSLGGLWTLRLY